MHLVFKASARLKNHCSFSCLAVVLLNFLLSLGSTTFTPTCTVTATAFLHPSITPSSSRRTISIAAMASIDETSLFWNREAAASSKQIQEKSQEQPIVKQAKIISLADPNDKANEPLHKLLQLQNDDEGFELLQVGSCMEDFDVQALNQAKANVVFVTGCPNVRETLAALCERIPTLEWIHTRSAGIEFCTSSQLQEWWCKKEKQHQQQKEEQQQQERRVMTNAKGQFSSTLAEYTLMACAYFAKDLPRLLRNKQDKNWEKYSVLELRNATMGIIGYGDIGKAGARLAKAYGMNVKALQRRRRRKPGGGDDNVVDVYCDEMFYMDMENQNNKTALNQIFADCDYILCALPLTPDTQGMIGKEQFDQVKPGRCACFINVGRGLVVDEQALIAALQPPDDNHDGSTTTSRGRLRGAALDVFSQEPLPTDSPLWTMDNVLLSPHNMDQTATFMEEATRFFVQVNLPRFVRGLPLLNPVNPVDGY